jgi:siroheme synthase-like protein
LASHYPVSLVVADQPCLVVGGGRVAARKIQGLAAAGAFVTVVAPEIVPAVEELAAEHQMTLERRLYRAGEAASYRLVITATGIPEVDALVSADAGAGGVWVNSADDPEHCSFLLPAIHRDGPVTVAVSTGGASPALATWLRRQVADAIGDDVGALAGILETARRNVQASGRSTESVDWQAILDGPLPAMVREGRLDEARRLLGEATA